MASTAEILSYLLKSPPKSACPIAYNYLVPNIKGLETLVNVLEVERPSAIGSSSPASSSQSLPEISLLAAATEAFSKANTNCTIAESLERIKPIVVLAREKN